MGQNGSRPRPPPPQEPDLPVPTDNEIHVRDYNLRVGNGEFLVDSPSAQGGRFRIDKNGNTTINGPLRLQSGKRVMFASDVPIGSAQGEKQVDAGTIGYNLFGVTDEKSNLSIVGAGRENQNRLSKIWDDVEVVNELRTGGNVVINDKHLRLRSSEDGYHALKFDPQTDGPVLYGSSGGSLGYTQDNGTTVNPVIDWNKDTGATVQGNLNSTEQLSAQNNYFRTDPVGIVLGNNNGNSWIFHTPTDGRNEFQISPGTNGSNWDWGKHIYFNKDGRFIVNGRDILAELNSAVKYGDNINLSQFQGRGSASVTGADTGGIGGAEGTGGGVGASSTGNADANPKAVDWAKWKINKQ
ncbi:MAG: hypothetical protein EHM20_09960 [Alphaproteobacteria bacterium]|nr:MAG: hypothetical protein EHM20_09960 [Alphaproteobacteria bacterium]